MGGEIFTAAKFGGNIPPSPTPTMEVGGLRKFDPVSSNRLDKHLIRGKVNGIFLLGTAGESPTISPSEYNAAINHRIPFIKKEDPNMPVLVGVSADNIDEMIRRAQFAEVNGADALVLVPLFGQGEAEEKLEALLKRTTRPIVLYDNPGIHTGENQGKDLSAEFVKDAKEKSNGRVIGIKITSPNRQMFEDCLKLQDNTFHVLQGGANIDTLHMEVDGQKVQGIVSFEAVIAPILINLLLKHPNNKLLIYMVLKLGKLAENPQKVKKMLKTMRILSTALMFKD